MRRRRFKRLWASLQELRNRKNITRDNLLMHIGALKKEAGRDFGLVRISLPNPQKSVSELTFHFELDRERLRRTLRRERLYLLRSNMQAASPEIAWESYLLLTRIEQAFKDLKGELSLRTIWKRELKLIFLFPFWLIVSTQRCEILHGDKLPVSPPMRSPNESIGDC